MTVRVAHAARDAQEALRGADPAPHFSVTGQRLVRKGGGEGGIRTHEHP
jgi:hypothetical protein